MHSNTRTMASALALGAFLMATAATGQAAAVTIDFETPAISTANAELPGTVFEDRGVSFRTVRLSGTVAVGATITLTEQNRDLRIYRDASAISGEQLAGPSLGGTSNDLLMIFADPLATLSLTSDDLVETGNPIRLIALAPTTTADRYRVVDFVEAQDDAVSAPANLLALSPSETFTLALFEVRTQQEAFDDLTFTFASATPIDEPPPVDPPVVQPPLGVPAPSSLMLMAGALGVAAAARRQTQAAGVRAR
jgi:hypothetical protein